MIMEYIILILLGSIMISISLSWISIQVAPKIGLMDIPGSAKHKKHRKPIPLTGGIVLIDTLFIMLFILGYFKEKHSICHFFYFIINSFNGVS